MDDKYIVIIDAQNKKNHIKYFPIDKKNEPVIKYIILNDIKDSDIFDEFILNKLNKSNIDSELYWKLETSNITKKNLMYKINKLFIEKKIQYKYYKNIACIFIKNKKKNTIIFNKISDTLIKDKNYQYLKSINIKFKKLHNIIEKYIKNNKSFSKITGGVKGETEAGAKQTSKALNPLTPPFNQTIPIKSPKSPKSPLSPSHPSSPKSPSSPSIPKVSRTCLSILRQEHSKKTEYMIYNTYRYHDEYISFKEYNEINILIPELNNITKKRKDKPIQQAEIESNRNGMTNIGAIIYNSHTGSEEPKIGTIIAANSGRPGGACGNFDGTADKIHPNHRTQEEDIVSNWFMTYAYNKNISEDDKEHYYNKLFQCTICNKWGLQYPYAKKTDQEKYYKTIQGINYRDAIPKEYADAWTINNVYLSDKNYYYKDSQYIHENQYKTTLVFVAGPNNNNPGTKGPINSVFRTYNKYTDERFDIFMKGVEAALFAGLIAMVRSKCNIALLVYVSGGVYRGKHDKDDYKNLYENIVNNLLMNVQINGVELGSYFDAVYLL